LDQKQQSHDIEPDGRSGRMIGGAGHCELRNLDAGGCVHTEQFLQRSVIVHSMHDFAILEQF
jgi:hypothetical protein